jgi:hypothetical protein
MAEDWQRQSRSFFGLIFSHLLRVARTVRQRLGNNCESY